MHQLNAHVKIRFKNLKLKLNKNPSKFKEKNRLERWNSIVKSQKHGYKNELPSVSELWVLWLSLSPFGLYFTGMQREDVKACLQSSMVDFRYPLHTFVIWMRNKANSILCVCVLVSVFSFRSVFLDRTIPFIPRFKYVQCEQILEL